MTDGQEVWVAFTTDSGDHHVYTATVVVAEHMIVQTTGGRPTTLQAFQSVHATEAEALAACAAEVRQRARTLDAKADQITAKAVACGVGPANPE